jgi:hypothetical protein
MKHRGAHPQRCAHARPALLHRGARVGCSCARIKSSAAFGCITANA